MKVDGFDWDEGNKQKACKRGLEQSEIESFFLERIWVEIDFKHSQIENRYRAIGKFGNKYLFVIFAVREKQGLKLIRPISARRMNKREVVKYEKEITETENR